MCFRAQGDDGSSDGSDMSDEGLDGMSNLTSEEEGSMYLMDGQVTPCGNQTHLSSGVTASKEAMRFCWKMG